MTGCVVIVAGLLWFASSSAPVPEWCQKACFGKVGQFSPAEIPGHVVIHCEDGAHYFGDTPEMCGARGGVKYRSASSEALEGCFCQDGAIITRETD